MNPLDEQERFRQQMELWRRQEEKRRLDDLEARRLEYEARLRTQEEQRQRHFDEYRRAEQVKQKQIDEDKKRAALFKKENALRLAKKKEAEKKRETQMGSEAMERAMKKGATPEQGSEGRAAFIKAKRVLPSGQRVADTKKDSNQPKMAGGAGCLLLFAAGYAVAAANWLLLHK
jgi:membrane protein involved in colicin uptake